MRTRTLILVCMASGGLCSISGRYGEILAVEQPSGSKPNPAGTTERQVDYARSEHWQAWTHHPVFGDASFDNFVRLPGNPVCRGTEEFEWPVNGSLFKDPVSGDWFLYVSWYKKGYANKDGQRSHSTVYRSNDRGKTWKDCGEPLSGAGTHRFDGDTAPFWRAQDVTVCYKDGRYHMGFGWATKYSHWESFHRKDDPNINSGAAYAAGDSPAGPFKPIVAYAKTREMEVLLGKYNRLYGSTLLPRSKDWIAFTMVDSGQYLGWGLVVQTAPKPEGPWTKPKLLLHPQLPGYFPQLLEIFPQVIKDGFVYAVGTSIAANRNYQILLRAPLEKATDSAAWEIAQEGSLWHAEPVESEYEGIWGQCFWGFIDRDGTFYAMFPSLDSQNRGTIGLACRPWDKPLRERGFVVSAHPKPSMTVLKHTTELRRLNAQLTVRGTVRILWSHHGPFGDDKLGHGAGLHRLMQSQYDAFELSSNKWALVQYDKQGQRKKIAAGQTADTMEYSVGLEMDGENLKLTLNGKDCWNGAFNSKPGRVGIWVEPRSHAEVNQFEVQGAISATSMDFLYTEALQCAAQNMKDWEKVQNERFRYGEGVVSKSDSVEVKWNFIGDGFCVRAPTGPAFGKGELWLDGQRVATVNFLGEQEKASQILYKKRDLPYGRHGLTLKVAEGRMPVDVLEVFTR